jgi:hypothetical protein
VLTGGSHSLKGAVSLALAFLNKIYLIKNCKINLTSIYKEINISYSKNLKSIKVILNVLYYHWTILIALSQHENPQHIFSPSSILATNFILSPIILHHFHVICSLPQMIKVYTMSPVSIVVRFGEMVYIIFLRHSIQFRGERVVNRF